MARKINDIFFMRPWAVDEDTLCLMSEIINRHANGEKLSLEDIKAKIGASDVGGVQYEVINGVANIPISGVISKRASLVKDISVGQGTSIDEIKKNFADALADPAVKSILLNVDSPGGSVDGVAELSDMIYNARGQKPICAYADGQMASAAYWIGSAADKIIASQGADVGSIGVYSVVKDLSRAYKNAGIETTIVKAGKYKAAGHPMKQMTQDDQDVIQKKVNAHYKMFTNAVARNRGMSADKIQAAATGESFMASEAKDLGLIDGIDVIDSLFPAAQAGDKGKRIAASDAIVSCGACKKEFHLIEQPEVAMGATKCPHCKTVVDQNGKVAKEQPQGITREGNMAVEFKELTVDALKRERPDLVGSIESVIKVSSDAVKVDAVKAETARVVAILDKSKGFLDVAGVPELVKASIEKGESVEAAEKAFMQKKLDALQGAAPAKPGANAAEPVKAKTHLELAREYAKEHKCSMTVALNATAPARSKK
jgi:signal peptide peptidase SppA